ncbi:MAG: hypothetical protein JJU36_08820 [Phycisphaeraceae bacterium]|nr:hypothetical protein [Phycisphaeraceae bacterium]
MNETNDSTGRTLDPEFVAKLACPVTRSPLRQEGDWLIAAEGGRRYPIRDRIPILLAEEAVMDDPAGTDESQDRSTPGS